ncbi:hypothetical protein MC885_003590 [Smutsia gigantea]|nr:hypothetical protein MC885_003590 [Smutsia gigantea]
MGASPFCQETSLEVPTSQLSDGAEKGRVQTVRDTELKTVNGEAPTVDLSLQLLSSESLPVAPARPFLTSPCLLPFTGAHVI